MEVQMDRQFPTFAERFKSAETVPDFGSDNIALTLGMCVELSQPDKTKQREIWEKALLPVYKDIGTTDIQSLRVVSLSDRMSELRNEDTKFLNLLESQGRFPRVTDYQYRIRERRQPSSGAVKFNVDGTLPTANQSSRKGITNTLTAVGYVVKSSIVAGSMAEQQADVDLLAEELDDGVNEIRREMSKSLISNTEIVSEASGDNPQLRGFIEGATTNVGAVSGGNLTEAVIQTEVNDIRTKTGSGKQLIMWIPGTQVQIVDNLMIQRYPGQNSEASRAQGSALRQLIEADVVPDLVYQPRPGRPIPVVFDDQLPSGKGLLFAWQPGIFPLMPKFRLNGQLGPWVLVRPNTTLFEFVLEFDMFTLDDPYEETRSVWTGLS